MDVDATGCVSASIKLRLSGKFEDIAKLVWFHTSSSHVSTANSSDNRHDFDGITKGWILSSADFA